MMVKFLNATNVKTVHNILAENANFQCAIFDAVSRILCLTMNFTESTEKEILVVGYLNTILNVPNAMMYSISRKHMTTICIMSTQDSQTIQSFR